MGWVDYNVICSFRLPLEVAFTAVDKREFIFHLICNVKNKLTPLSLNVKAEVYAIKMSLSATDVNGQEIILPVDKNSFRQIDFGKVNSLLQVVHVIDLYL